MRGLKLTVGLTGAPDRANELIVSGVLEEVIAPITVAKIVSAVRSKTGVGGTKTPAGVSKETGFLLHCLTISVPYEVAFKRRFREKERDVVWGEIDELTVRFLADIDAVAASRGLAGLGIAGPLMSPEGADEVALRVEDEDGIGSAVMGDVDEALTIDRDTVRGSAVVVAGRQIVGPPVVVALVDIVSLTDAGSLGASLVRRIEDERKGAGDRGGVE